MARLIVFLIFGAFGVVLLVVGATQFVQQRRLLAAAEPIDVEIVRSEVFSSESKPAGGTPLRDRSTTSHRPEIAFRYQVDGATYESDLLHPTIIVQGYASRESAAEVLREYPLGARVQAYVDRTRPDKAFLRREASIAPLVFMIVGVALVPLAWFASRLV